MAVGYIGHALQFFCSEFAVFSVLQQILRSSMMGALFNVMAGIPIAI